MARTTFAQNGLVRLGYETQGDGGPAVLLLHGLLSDRASLRPLPDALEDDATTIVMDLRGHGGSSAIHGVDLQLHELVKDAFAVLDAAYVTTPAVVVGVGLGAVIAADMQATHPDRVASTVLVNYPTSEMLNPETLKEIATLAYREQAEQALNRWLDLAWGEGWKESMPKPRIASARRSAGAIHPLLSAMADGNIEPRESISAPGGLPFEDEATLNAVMEQIRPLLTSG